MLARLDRIGVRLHHSFSIQGMRRSNQANERGKILSIEFKEVNTLKVLKSSPTPRHLSPQWDLYLEHSKRNFNESFLSASCLDTGISVEFDLDEVIWRLAGRAFKAYASRRRKQRDPGPRRILADFLIGAHASHRGYRLLTLDDHLYKTAFSALTLVTI
jgi:hypothetical protein